MASISDRIVEEWFCAYAALCVLPAVLNKQNRIGSAVDFTKKIRFAPTIFATNKKT